MGEVYLCIGPDPYIGKYLFSANYGDLYGVWLDGAGVLSDMTMDKEKLEFKLVKAALQVED